jgi:hypothetical protein
VRLSTPFPFRRAARALACFLLVTGFDAGASAQKAPQRRAATTAGSVVFVVSGVEDGSGGSLDALAFVAGGRFSAPYPDQEMDAAKRFAAKYYRPGAKYRLTFGGGDAGTFTVREASDGCNNVHASGTADTTAPLRGRVMGLATDADAPGRRASARRAPEPAEREAALALARSVLRQRRTPAPLVARMQVTNLTATDIDGDGRFELVGSFVVDGGARQPRRDLFLIAAPHPAGLRADFVHFQSYRPPPEGFTSAVDFVDQLDMDGDRIGEVVTVDAGFDAYGYSIYKKRRGRWVKVLSVLGDGC